MQGQGTRVYRVKAVAEMLDVHPATIYRAIADGRLDAYKIGSGRGALRVPSQALTAFLDECGEAAWSEYVAGRRNPAEDDDPGAGAGFELEPGRLTGAQAHGLACVVCNADLRDPVEPARVPVGESQLGCPVLACATHTPDAVREAQAIREDATGQDGQDGTEAAGGAR